MTILAETLIDDLVLDGSIGRSADFAISGVFTLLLFAVFLAMIGLAFKR